MTQDAPVPVTGERITQIVDRFCGLWNAESLADRISVEFSPRMSRSLGRAFPARNLIRLRHDLQVQPRRLLTEVLVHELAHLVAWQQFGPRIRPHGSEWQALMRRAGFDPAVSLDVPASAVPGFQVRRYRHSCPVCHTSRVAYRSMRSWRCGACFQQGRPGRLAIEELA